MFHFLCHEASFRKFYMLFILQQNLVSDKHRIRHKATLLLFFYTFIYIFRSTLKLPFTPATQSTQVHQIFSHPGHRQVLELPSVPDESAGFHMGGFTDQASPQQYSSVHFLNTCTLTSLAHGSQIREEYGKKGLFLLSLQLKTRFFLLFFLSNSEIFFLAHYMQTH